MKRPSRWLILLLVLSVAFAFGYAAIESVHDCHGEDCPICKIIAVITAFFGVVLSFYFLFFSLLRSRGKEVSSRAAATVVTPVKLKVKLLN